MLGVEYSLVLEEYSRGVQILCHVTVFIRTALEAQYSIRQVIRDCQVPGSAPEPYARQSSTGYLYLLVQETYYRQCVYNVYSVSVVPLFFVCALSCMFSVMDLVV